MTVTDILRKPGLLPVLLVGAAFVAVDLGVAMPAILKEMQAKAKASGLDIFDWFILACITVACVGKSLAAFMNKSFTRLTDGIARNLDPKSVLEVQILAEVVLPGGGGAGRQRLPVRHHVPLRRHAADEMSPADFQSAEVNGERLG